MTGDIEKELREANQRIDFLLTHPGISGWLRETVRSALKRRPIDVLNDLEMLDRALRYKFELMQKLGKNT